MLISFVLAILLLISTLGGISSLRHLFPSYAKSGFLPASRFQEVTLESSSADEKIAVIEVEGLISSQTLRGGHNMVETIHDQLKVAGKDDSVRGVLLKVDSPGGEVLASDDIARAITDFQRDWHKPVVATMGSLAASGGYYVSAPCQWIVANELTLTGSIGVIMHSFNYRNLLDKVGVTPQVFKTGRFKDMLSGSKKLEDIDPAEKQMIQDMLTETFNRFKKVVADGRSQALAKNQSSGKALSKNWEDVADGRVLTGRQALELGFVDELGSFETGVERVKKLAKIGDAKLIRYEEPVDFSHLFNLFGQSESKAIKIDLGFDLPRLQAGRPYFLSPTLIH